MKNITDYINKEYHLRNLELDIDEELRNFIDNPHSNPRKHQQVRKYLTKNITKEELIDLINKCDNQITNACLNKKITINDEFGIRKFTDIENNECLAIVCVLKYFNKDTLEYDILAKTNNRVGYEYKFRDVKFYCEIEKDGRIKTIY